MKPLSYLLLFLLVTATSLVRAQPDAININSADVKALAQLKGVGAKYAERIIQYRETNGPFKAGGEVQNVRGIGPKIYQTDLLFDDANVLNKPLFYIKKAGSRRKSGHSETHFTQITC